MRVGVALGSNVGSRLENLSKARAAIYSLPKVAKPFLASSVYETAPVGCGSGAGEFLNAVIEFEYQGDPRELMAEFRRIEVRLGRPSRHARNENRTIDIDLLYADDMRVQDPVLEIPHPRMASRLFVMQPLAEIRPELIFPGQRKPVAEIVAALQKTDTVRALTNEW
jgi:2-amino-4-hydroxy-6-hydroxymethyldihydropteridine diphosphokinase